MISKETFAVIKAEASIPVAVPTDVEAYLAEKADPRQLVPKSWFTKARNLIRILEKEEATVISGGPPLQTPLASA